METNFSKEQVVWAKVNGFPWWPGFIKSIKRNGEFEVVFFGDFSRANLQAAKIRDFANFEEKIDKKNKKLSEAYRIAERVHSGESSIATEQAFFETRAFATIARQKDRSVNSEQEQKSLSEDSDMGESEYRRPGSKRQLKLPGRASNFSESIYNSQAPDIAEGQLTEIKGLNKIKSTFGSAKQKMSKLQLQKHVSLPIEAQNAFTFKEVRNRIDLGEMQDEETQLPVIEDHDPPVPQPANNISEFGPNFANNFSTSIFQKPSITKEDEIAFAKVEDRLQAILTLLCHTQPDLQQIMSDLNSLLEDFSKAEPNYELLCAKKMGSSIALIASLCLEKAAQSNSFHPAFSQMREFVLKIKLGIFTRFFELREDHFDELDFSTNLESLLNLNRCYSGVLGHGQKKFYHGFCKKSVLNNNSNNMDKRGLQDREESAANGDSQSVLPDLEARVIYRVCKKIAKLIFLNGGKNTIRKQTCEDLATKIEDYIRRSSRSVTDYKQKILALFQKIEKRPEVVQSSFIKNCKGSNLDQLYDQVQNFINN